MRKICTRHSSSKLNTARIIGSEIENLAIEHLQNQGVEILQKNFYCKMGEIDIICQDNNQLAFVEVRYRKNTLFGTPAESITFAKQQKLIRAAQYYLKEHCSKQSLPCRFDVIAVTGVAKTLHLEWIQHAFELH